jgi:asparagine synthase (glutamine-hydrolysing)
MLEVVPRLPQIYDEPFADTSHIPTILLSELARKQVTVCLSGDGGDELFGGYSLYRKAELLWKIMQRISNPTRDRLANYLCMAAAMGLGIQNRLSGDPDFFKRSLRLSELLRASNDRELYQLLTVHCRNLNEWLLEPHSQSAAQDATWDSLPELLHRMMYQDFVRYLPDEVLVKVDRAAMSVSLETRIPLLDRRIIEFAWSLPLHFKKKRAQGKWLLRQVLHRYVPRKLVERPKQGFAAPVEAWIRKELRPWAEELLSESQLRQNGFFKAANVRGKWTDHLSGKGDWGQPLWNILMFQGWLESQKAQPPPIDSAHVSRSHAHSPAPDRSELVVP